VTTTDDEGGAGAPLQPMGSHPAAMDLQAESTESGVQHMEVRLVCSNVLRFVLDTMSRAALSTLVPVVAPCAVHMPDELSSLVFGEVSISMLLLFASCAEHASALCYWAPKMMRSPSLIMQMQHVMALSSFFSQHDSVVCICRLE
jgi:hypothetical protein